MKLLSVLAIALCALLVSLECNAHVLVLFRDENQSVSTQLASQLQRLLRASDGACRTDKALDVLVLAPSVCAARTDFQQAQLGNCVSYAEWACKLLFRNTTHWSASPTANPPDDLLALSMRDSATPRHVSVRTTSDDTDQPLALEETLLVDQAREIFLRSFGSPTTVRQHATLWRQLFEQTEQQVVYENDDRDIRFGSALRFRWTPANPNVFRERDIVINGVISCQSNGVSDTLRFAPLPREMALYLGGQCHLEYRLQFAPNGAVTVPPIEKTGTIDFAVRVPTLMAVMSYGRPRAAAGFNLWGREARWVPFLDTPNSIVYNGLNLDAAFVVDPQADRADVTQLIREIVNTVPTAVGAVVRAYHTFLSYSLLGVDPAVINQQERITCTTEQRAPFNEYLSMCQASGERVCRQLADLVGQHIVLSQDARRPLLQSCVSAFHAVDVPRASRTPSSADSVEHVDIGAAEQNGVPQVLLRDALRGNAPETANGLRGRNGLYLVGRTQRLADALPIPVTLRILPPSAAASVQLGAIAWYNGVGFTVVPTVGMRNWWIKGALESAIFVSTLPAVTATFLLRPLCAFAQWIPGVSMQHEDDVCRKGFDLGFGVSGSYTQVNPETLFSLGGGGQVGYFRPIGPSEARFGINVGVGVWREIVLSNPSLPALVTLRSTVGLSF